MRGTLRMLALLLVVSAPVSIRAASIPSPYRPTASPATAGRLAAEGQEALDFDARAQAALRDATATVVEIDAFPVAPGETARLRLSRFEVASPDAKITLRGKDGDTTRPLPLVKHFRGTVEGEPESSVYVGVASDMVLAWVQSSRGHAYVGPDEGRSGYIVRTADSPLNAAATAAPWKCAQENLPQHVSLPAPPSATPAPANPNLAGFQQAMVD